MPEPAPQPRAAHRPSRRQDVIEAGIRVFSREGINASVTAVAEESGMSAASVYYHFPTKEQLLEAALEEIAARISRHTFINGSDQPRDVRGSVESTWAYHRAHPDETRLLYSLAANAPRQAKEVRSRFVERHVRQVQARLRRDKGEGTRTQLAIEELAARAYVRLAMNVAETWASGAPVAGLRSKKALLDALTRVGELTTTADLAEDAPKGRRDADRGRLRLSGR